MSDSCDPMSSNLPSSSVRRFSRQDYWMGCVSFPGSYHRLGDQTWISCIANRYLQLSCKRRSQKYENGNQKQKRTHRFRVLGVSRGGGRLSTLVKPDFLSLTLSSANTESSGLAVNFITVSKFSMNCTFRSAIWWNRSSTNRWYATI